MKKFLLLILAMALVLSCFVSCNNNGNGGNTNNNGGNDNGTSNNGGDPNGGSTDGGNNGDPNSGTSGSISAELGTVEYIAQVVSTSKPTKIVTHVNYFGEDILSGFYTTEIDRANKTSQFSFEYDRIAIPGQDKSEDYIMTETGTVKFKDGEVLVSEGSDWQTLGDGYLSLALTVSQSLFSGYEISENGWNLTATISADNAERVLGTSINAEGDIALEITTNGTYLYSVTISYAVKTLGSDTNTLVTVETSYDYVPVVLEF